MRKVGVVLTIVGFAWLIELQVASLMRVGLRPILQDRYEELEKLPEADFTRATTAELIRETALSVYLAQPLFVIPGGLMFVGGLFLAFAGKRPHPLVVKSDATDA